MTFQVVRVPTFGAVASVGAAARLTAGQWVSFRWGCALDGLATRRQLTAAGLRPGGQEPCAEVRWRRGRRWAQLYRVADAKPKRTATPAQLQALERAMVARRTCRSCNRDAGYCLPLPERYCLDCLDDTRENGVARR
ncbi:hypothetical protein NUM3379_35110 [Kineococcus sp. NUM-3379]